MPKTEKGAKGAGILDSYWKRKGWSDVDEMTGGILGKVQQVWGRRGMWLCAWSSLPH